LLKMGAGRPAGKLRGELTEFVGRRAELALVRAALEGARLVTLTGPGESARRGWRCRPRPGCGERSGMGRGWPSLAVCGIRGCWWGRWPGRWGCRTGRAGGRWRRWRIT
jgi:hypothetical protein